MKEVVCMAWKSVVDYMKATKLDSSFGSRAKLAKQYGINGYKGTSQQNVALMNKLQAQAAKPKTVTPTKAVAKPVAKPVATNNNLTGIRAAQKSWFDNYSKQVQAGTNNKAEWQRYVDYGKHFKAPLATFNKENTQQMKNLRSAQQTWFNNYSKQIQSGTNNAAEWQRYQDYAKHFKFNTSKPTEDTLRQLSIKALNGDKTASNLLKTMGVNSLSGSSLWKGVDPSKLQQGSTAWSQYMTDNAFGSYAKNYDMNTYKTYSDVISKGGAISDAQMEAYRKVVDKWNLQDISDPFYQQQQQLEKDKKAALEAQDIALNQGLATQDASNFQQFQQLQQNMAGRGLTDSGIASGAYLQSQMAANQAYQQAYADSATTKSGIQSDYNNAISESKLGQRAYQDERYDAEMANQAAQTKAQAELQNSQTEMDKYLTSSTGYVYMNGKMLTHNGKPLTSLEYAKLDETKRHNLATENNTANKNAQDYQLGMDSNSIRRQQIAADLQISMSKMKLDYAKLDYNYTKLEADNKVAQDKIKIASDNAQTSADKAKITALGKQLTSVTSQITAYQKKGKKPPKTLVEQYNNITGQLESMSGNFKSGSGGGDSSGSLGTLSKKYESGSSGAGTIGNNAGDWGGKSYGTYQIASNTGTMNSFMSYLKKTNPVMYNSLAKYKVGSSGFDSTWKSLASSQGIQFQAAQHAFIKQSHYDPAVSKLSQSTGINANSRSSALQNVIWSIGVQHGSGGANSIFKAAGINNNMGDREIIQRLYAERSKVSKYFSRSSSAIQRSVYNRFQNELRDALAML